MDARLKLKSFSVTMNFNNFILENDIFSFTWQKDIRTDIYDNLGSGFASRKGEEIK